MPRTSERKLGYRDYRSSEGFAILVGRDAEENDRLTFELADAEDFWLHVAGSEGSHVVVRNPGRLPRLPRATRDEAAALAAYHSKARGSARAAVHMTRVRSVRKRRGMPPGTVELSSWDVLRVRPEVPRAVNRSGP